MSSPRGWWVGPEPWLPLEMEQTRVTILSSLPPFLPLGALGSSGHINCHLSSPSSCFSHREDIFLWAQVFIKSGTRKDSIWWALNFSYMQLPSFHHLPSPIDTWVWSSCKNLRLLPRHSACWILLPSPGLGPMPPAVGPPSPNYWTTREVPANSSTALSSTQ